MENLIITCMVLTSIIAAINIAFLIDIHKQVKEARKHALNAYSNASDAETKAALACYKLDSINRRLDTVLAMKCREQLDEEKKKYKGYKDRLNEALTDIHTHLLMRGVDCDVRTNECYNGKKCITLVLNYPLHADTVNPIKDILRSKRVYYEGVSCDGRYWLYIFRDEC